MVSQGRVPYHEHDEEGQIHYALDAGLQKRHIRLNDRRLLIIYLLNAIIIAGMFWGLRSAQVQSAEDTARFEKAVVANCQSGKRNAENFNQFINKLVASYATNPDLSDAEKKQSADFFEGAKSEVPECPPGR